jgi:tRNA (uracil-5-)-methyltransferase TRM9
MLLKPLFLSARPPYSRFLIYVWAFEQGENSKRKMGILAPTEEMGGVQKGQDVMVPWVVPIKQEKKVKEVKVKRKKRVEGGTDDMISATEIKDTTTITTRMNETTLHNDTSRTEPKEATAAQQAQVFHRYYHLYMKGELRESVLLAASEMGFCIKDDNEKQPAGDKGTKWLRIAEEGYEKDNWYLEGEVGVY